MAETKAKGPAVSAETLPNGDVALGVTVGGRFAPLIVTPAYRVEQLQDNYADTGDGDGDDS